jgi:polyisoprenoid-binding protein YceI
MTTKWNIDTTHSSVEFGVKHLGISWIKGRFLVLRGTIEFDADHPEKTSVEAEIEAKSIWTGDEKRDGHLRSKDFFDVERFPLLTFKSREVKKINKNEFRISGDLTMRGVTRPVTLEVPRADTREYPSPEGKSPTTRVGLVAKTTINRHDFGVSWDAPAGEGATMVEGDVEVVLNIEAVKA